MRIAIRSGKSDRWEEVSDGDQHESISIDGYMKDLIHQLPDLIPIEELTSGEPSLKVCIKDLSTNGSTDDSGRLVGIDNNGKITIVECKIADDPFTRTWQALEYAANLWNRKMSYEEFDNKVLNSEGKSLTELMSSNISAGEWSQEKFKDAVTSSLQRGKFRLILTTVSGTPLPDGLKQTIKFLNAQGLEMEICAVEMQRFSYGQTEIIVPTEIISLTEPEQQTPIRETVLPPTSGLTKPITGRPERLLRTPSSIEPTVARPEWSARAPGLAEPAVARPERSTEILGSSDSTVTKQERSARTPGPSKTSFTKPRQQAEPDQVAGKDESQLESFFAECKKRDVSDDAIKIIGRLYNFSTEAADNIIWWGAGGAGAFNFVLTEDELTVFIVDANGKIMFNFSDWQRDASYRDLLPQFIDRLRAIPILREQREHYTKWPDFDVGAFFANPDDFTTFEKAISFLKEQLKNLATV